MIGEVTFFTSCLHPSSPFEFAPLNISYKKSISFLPKQAINKTVICHGGYGHINIAQIYRPYNTVFIGYNIHLTGKHIG